MDNHERNTRLSQAMGLETVLLFDTDHAAREGLLEWILQQGYFIGCADYEPCEFMVTLQINNDEWEGSGDTYAEAFLSAIDAALRARVNQQGLTSDPTS